MINECDLRIFLTKGCCIVSCIIYLGLASRVSQCIYYNIQPCICELAVYMTERIDFDDCLPGWGKGASS